MIRQFQPHGIHVGEVLRTEDKQAGTPKYHLCVAGLDVSNRLHFVRLNTAYRNRRKPGRLVVPYKCVLLPRPQTGLTEFDLSMIRRFKPSDIGSGAVVFPPIGRGLAGRLAKFVKEDVKTLTGSEKSCLVEALLSITFDDPNRDMHRRLRQHLYRPQQPHDPAEKQRWGEAAAL